MTSDKKADLFFVYDIVKYPANVEIVELKNESTIPLGMSCESYNLSFGIIPIGVKSKKIINLANDKEEIYKVEIYAYGNISPMVSFDRNNFILKKGDEIKVTVTVDSNLCKKPGKYFGEIDVVSKRARIPFLSVIL
jgi:hypothetical protein